VTPTAPGPGRGPGQGRGPTPGQASGPTPGQASGPAPGQARGPTPGPGRGAASEPRPGQVHGLTRGLQKVRATYGAALVFAPGLMIWLATGQLPSRRARRVAQVLGARHLMQAALTAAAPEPAALAIGGQVDALHAGSMLALAAVSRTGRRAALADALTEAALAAAGRAAAGVRA
jgi:hypothetical protein